MTELTGLDHFGVLVVVLGGIATSLVAGVPAFLSYRAAAAAKGHAARTDEQVSNNHTTNMRDEQDVRHTENGRKLDRLTDIVTRIEKNVEALVRNDATQDYRLDEVEQTIGRKRP